MRTAKETSRPSWFLPFLRVVVRREAAPCLFIVAICCRVWFVRLNNRLVAVITVILRGFFPFPVVAVPNVHSRLCLGHLPGTLGTVMSKTGNIPRRFF